MCLIFAKIFTLQFYNDTNPRHLILGINPGRFGSGLTGIPFTDPVKLEQECKISNELKKKAELSSDFIYAMINAAGGPTKFYSHFYFGSVSPLGFTMHDKKLNYYDIPDLQTALLPFIKTSLLKQISFGIKTDQCFVLGEGKNYAFLTKLNNELKLFQKLTPLPHPRFIMQYKRRQLHNYINLYKKALLT